MNRKVIALVLVLSSLAIFQCRGGDEEPTELHFIVTFKDAKGLRPGQFLVYKGVRIGEVSAVDLDGAGVNVNLTVGETYRAQVYKEATFTIEKLTIINPTGEHQVVMADSGKVRTPVEEGTTIVGSEGWLSSVTESLKDAASSAARAAGQMVGDSEPQPSETPSSAR
jgi:ABC-type transporter Mla subunit MlaD